MAKETMKHIVCVGGGVNSTAMVLMMIERGMQIDEMLYADTGAEMPHTIEHIKQLSEYTINKIRKPIVVVKYKVGIYDDCVARQCLPAIAYGFKSCSMKFKHQPQQKYISLKYGCHCKYYRYIGFDYNEFSRMRDATDNRVINVYPLVDAKLTRKDCIEICNQYKFYPKKSSCYICAALKLKEIGQLALDYPELIEKALELESNAKLISVKGLGRRFAWRDVIKSQLDKTNIFCIDNNIDIKCTCWD